MSGINNQIKQLISDRLDHGQREYGQDLPLNDNRDLVLESLEEVLDGMVYIAGQIIRIKESEKSKE